MSPEREKLIRDTWADRRRWIGGWSAKFPRFNVVPTKQRGLLSSEPPTDALTIDYLTFNEERGRLDGIPWLRITCEGLVLDEGPAPETPLIEPKPA